MQKKIQISNSAEKFFMQIAIKEAIKGVTLGRGGPFGAVIVKNGKIIAKAHNTVIGNNDPTAHAEVNAIRKACAKLQKFTLEDCAIFSTCEPCPMCLSAIHWARIPVLYYACTRKDAEMIGFDDNLLYKIFRKKKIKSAHLQIRRLLRKEALVAFEIWKNKVDKIQY